jgi:hypothetical protein
MAHASTSGHAQTWPTFGLATGAALRNVSTEYPVADVPHTFASVLRKRQGGGQVP